jgi:hypothetical protein
MALELDIIKTDTTWNDAAASLNNNFGKVKLAIAQSEASGGGIVDKEMSDTSENAVQNKVIKAYSDKHPEYSVIGEETDAPDFIDNTIVLDDFMSDTSENGVQNKVIKGYVDKHDNELNEKYKQLEHLKDMFYWEDENRTIIGTKFPFFSEKSVTAAGKKDDSSDMPVLDEARLEEYLTENEYVTQSTLDEIGYASTDELGAVETRVDKLEKNDAALEERVEDLEKNGTGGGTVEGLGDLAYKNEADLNLKALAHKDSLTYIEVEDKPASLAEHNYYDSVYYSLIIESSDYRKIGYSDSTIGKGAAIAFGKMDIPSVIQFVERDGNNNIDIEVRQKKIDADNTIVTMTDRVVTEKAAENGDIVFDKLHIGDAVLSWDDTAKMLKFNKGIYSIGAVSAGEKGTTYTYQFDNWSDWVWAEDAYGNKLAIPTNTKLLDYALSARLGVLLNERVTKIEDNAPIGNLALNFGTIARKVGRGEVDNDTMANEVGLTEQAIENILDGRYNKVVGKGANRDVWDYSAYVKDLEICIFLRQGNAMYVLKYNKSESTWTIADEA